MSAIWVVVRTTPPEASMRAMSGWRSALVGATTRHSRSPGAGGGVDLEHLGDGGEVLDHRLERALGDLEGDEREDLVAETVEVEVGAEAGDDAAAAELVEPGLHRAAGHLELAGQLHHAGSRGLGEGSQQPGVEPVDLGRHGDGGLAQRPSSALRPTGGARRTDRSDAAVARTGATLSRSRGH